MITEEQIKKLHPGDHILVHATFIKSYNDGDILFSTNYSSGRGTHDFRNFVSPSCVSLPKCETIESDFPTSQIGKKNTEPAPKYDPCRRFKKGDKVRVVQKWGRIPASAGTIGEVYTVAEDEENEKRITLVSKRNGYFWCDFFHLELVTPVEELEPYYVGDCKDDPDCQFFYIQNNNEISDGLLEEVARFVYNTDYTADKETARKRAEEYCDSLNAEYRKEVEK